MRNARGTKKSDLRRRKERKESQHFLRLAKIAGVLLLAFTFIGLPVYAFTNGWFAKQGERFIAYTGKSGLAISETEIYATGRAYTEKEDIVAALDVKPNQPTLAFDPARARKRLENLPWIKSATVERRFPGAIVLNITERRPFAFWQQNKKLSLIDETGAVLTTEKLDRFAGLPQIIGNEAPVRATALFSDLSLYPEIARRLQIATLVGERRWDLKLRGGVTVRLPENDVQTALARLSAADAEGQLLNRDILVVDLRLSDRLVVETSQGAAERRVAPKEGI